MVQTKRELAYEHIKKKIMRGDFLPGQRIVTSQVAQEIGTSFIPVREALFKLQSENLVTITPHIGAVVALVTIEKVLRIIETLAVLEGYATRIARPTSDGIQKKLDKLQAEMVDYVAKERWDRFSQCNRDFHFTIYEACGSPPLIGSIRSLWSQLDSVLSATSFYLMPERARSSAEDHLEIIRMLRDTDVEPLDVELFAREHKMQTAHFLRQNYVPTQV